MAHRSGPLIAGAAGLTLLAACSSPFDDRPHDLTARLSTDTHPAHRAQPSRHRPAGNTEADAPELRVSDDPDAFVRYALYHSPSVEAAYQRWRAAAEQVPQARALPDPRLNVGFFLDEVETRVGPQQARVGVSQTFPSPGTLSGREEAARLAAESAWQRFEAARLAATERVVAALHELAYLDAATRITRENLGLLTSFEEVVRARYRVGAGTHPELVRVQVELGQLEDRVAQLEAMRPAYVAELNAELNRPPTADIEPVDRLPGREAAVDADELARLARAANPTLRALEREIEQERALEGVARAAGRPDLTVGLDYVITDDAANSSIPESSDDPVMLSFGITVPLWREKYDAGVRQALARRLAATSDHAGEANRLGAAIHRAWFEHTDAQRRVRLFERTLIPKAEESLRASLAGFRSGETSFLDLLDTERTLLEFAVAAERARADRGRALARLNALVGEEIPTRRVDDIPGIDPGQEAQP